MVLFLTSRKFFIQISFLQTCPLQSHCYFLDSCFSFLSSVLYFLCVLKSQKRKRGRKEEKDFSNELCVCLILPFLQTFLFNIPPFPSLLLSCPSSFLSKFIQFPEKVCFCLVVGTIKNPTRQVLFTLVAAFSCNEPSVVVSLRFTGVQYKPTVSPLSHRAVLT